MDNQGVVNSGLRTMEMLSLAFFSNYAVDRGCGWWVMDCHRRTYEKRQIIREIGKIFLAGGAESRAAEEFLMRFFLYYYNDNAKDNPWAYVVAWLNQTAKRYQAFKIMEEIFAILSLRRANLKPITEQVLKSFEKRLPYPESMDNVQRKMAEITEQVSQ